jgi:uncharacterized protein (TIGR01777 family)
MEVAMNILVTGATGLIGRALCSCLASEGHRIVALTRSSNRLSDVPQLVFKRWDPMSGPPGAEALDGVEAIVHLAGEPIVARRWTDTQKKLIRDSRVVSTRHLVEAIRSMKPKPQVFVCGSAVGFYGERGDEQLEEDSRPGRGFLSDVCVEWEREAVGAAEEVRSVQVRTGVVLSSEGGALEKMITPFKLGVGGPLGSGRQWFPWIHIRDIVGVFRHALITASLRGPVNGVAPEPATNAEFTRALGRALHRPAFIPVPEFAMRALMGEMADVLFVSQRVVPTAALASGYEFHYSLLTKALENLLEPRAAAS